MISLILAVAAHAAHAALADQTATLRALDQALFDAVAPGDPQRLWAKTLTADAFYVDENGSVMSRADFLKELKPLPAGASGHIAISEYRAVFHGDTAQVWQRADEDETYHGVPLKAQYLLTESWRREAGAWKLAMVHVYVTRPDPPAVTLPAADVAAYVGAYRLNDLSYTIRLEGDRLTGQQGGGSARPLLAELKDVLFVAGRPRVRMIFQRDAQGRVTGYIDRREGEDLVWTREP